MYDIPSKGDRPQVLTRTRIVTGVVGLVVTLNGVAAAEGDSTARPRFVGVMDETKLPEKVADAHQRLQAALTEAARAVGWQPVISTATLDCGGKPGCYSRAAAGSGLDAILRVSGGRNSSDGYDITVQLSTAAGGTRSVVGSCSFCVVEDLARISERVTKEALAEPLPAPPAPPSARDAELPPSTAAAPAPATPAVAPESSRRLVAPIIVGAAGIALVGVGISLWAIDSNASGECRTPATGARDCKLYDTLTLGQVLTGAGALGAIVAGVLVYRVLHVSPSVAVSVGPSGVVMGGRF